jgi:hypothetical protein
MKFLTHFRHIRKGVLLFFVLALVAGYSVHDAISHYNGILIAGYAEAGGCNAGAGPGATCHGNSSTTTVLHLSTPSKIVAGQTYTLTLSVANPNPVDVAAGFDVDVDTPAMLNTISGTDSTVQVAPFPDLPPELYSITHLIPQWFNVNGPHSDSAVWSFQYTARPTAGIDTLYVAGNAVNGDSAEPNDSDFWDSVTVYLNVVSSDGVASSSPSGAIQVYPNPASNAMYINDDILSDEGSYTLTDPAGRVVLYGRAFPLDGRHSVDVSRIATGAYMLNVQPKMGKAFSRSVVIQR